MSRNRPLHDRMTAAAIYLGLLLLGAGGGLVLNAAAEGTPASNPEPGSRAYYEQNVRGTFAFDRGALVPLPVIQNPSAAGARPVPPVPRGARTVEGRVLQVLSNNFVVIGRPVTNMSGAVSIPRSCLLQTAGNRVPAEGAWLQAPTVFDGSYTCATASGTNITLYAYREVIEPTYEEYRQIYERDCQAGLVDPLVSVARMTNAPPGVVRAVPAPAVVPPPDTSAQSYMERLRQRREELRAQSVAPAPSPLPPPP